MGSNTSKLNSESSEVGTLNWNKSEENNKYLKKNVFSSKNLDNGLQEIDLEIKPFTDTENSINEISDVFKKIHNEISKSEEMKLDDSSPFISTELYKRIIGGENSSDPKSPLISTSSFINKFNLEGGGGHNFSSSSSSSSSFSDSEKSTSSSEILKALSDIEVSSSDYPLTKQKKKEFKKYHKSNYHSSSSSPPLKGYNFSETSSMMSNYKGGNTSETSYKLDSDSIRTSDINLVSVDSVNGRRFLN